MSTLVQPYPSPVRKEFLRPFEPLTPILSGRISSIDVLRGFALLGILVLNINDLGNVQTMHDIPVGTPIDNFSGPHAHLNLIVFLIKWTFFEAKMRGIFSMLFGAGVILMTERAERRGDHAIADIYTRRNMLLMLFGFLHACFIWSGDILFDYGFDALLFLYPCRRLKAKTLLWLGAFLSLFFATFGAVLFLNAGSDLTLSHQAETIKGQIKAGTPATAQQQAILQQWQTRVDSQRVTPQKIQLAFNEATVSYWDGVVNRANFGFQGGFHVLHIDLLADYVSGMLIGMGLMKLNFFSAELPFATYWWTALVGFAISIPLYVVGVLKTYASGFDFLVTEKWLFFPYYLTKDAGMLAIAAVILLVIKAGLLKTPQRLLAAVGRTAFSNYILTSLICQTIFLWGPWKLFGRLEYYQLMYVVFGVWIVNLVFSSLWLRSFAFGPLEWLWRSLTYGAMQPMRVKD
jgi:uncharacterized protein